METAENNRLLSSALIDLHPELALGLVECLRGLEQFYQGNAIGVVAFDRQEQDMRSSAAVVRGR